MIIINVELGAGSLEHAAAQMCHVARTLGCSVKGDANGVPIQATPSMTPADVLDLYNTAKEFLR
jgi:hypothetical protein